MRSKSPLIFSQLNGETEKMYTVAFQNLYCSEAFLPPGEAQRHQMLTHVKAGL